MNTRLATMARVEEQVYDKIRDNTFHAIVNRAFMGALPMNKSDLNKDSVHELSRFSKAALEAAGGYALLENAIENCKDPSKRNFLEDIQFICEESARMVATRVALEAGGENPNFSFSDPEPVGNSSSDAMEGEEGDNEDGSTDDPAVNDAPGANDPVNDDEDDDESIDDIKSPDDTKAVPLKPQVIRQGVAFKNLVADAKMTDEEYARYVKMRGRLDLPEVSKLINHKVEQAMLAEKETYQMIDEANQKLKDVITDKADEEGDIVTDEQAEEIKESVLEVPLKNSPREHVSVFSKIQAAAIEAVLCKENIDIERPDANLMLDITTKYTFDIFNNVKEPTLEQTLDNLINYKAATEACGSCGNQHQLMNLGTAFATIIYTFLQALHSMNLTTFTTSMARNLCEKNGPLGDNEPRSVGNNVDNRVRAALETEARAIRKMETTTQLEAAIGQLTKLKNKLITVKESGIPLDIVTMNKIEELTREAMTRKASYESSMESAIAIPGSAAVAERYFETDKYEVGRVATTFRNTELDKIVFKCTEGASIINVIGMNEGRPVKQTSVALESAYNVPTEKYLKMLVNSSKLKDTRFGDSLPAIESWIGGKHTNLR